MLVTFNNAQLAFTRNRVPYEMGLFLAHHCSGGFDDALFGIEGKWIFAKGGLALFVDRNMNLFFCYSRRHCYVHVKLDHEITRAGLLREEWTSRYAASLTPQVYSDKETLHLYL